MRTCGCIDRIQDEMRERYYPDAEYIFIDREMLSGKTYSTLTVRLPGKKKEKEVSIFHTFCPWCGVRYSEEAADGRV